MNKPFDVQKVGGKSVYIFSAHHFALLPWAEVRRTLQAAPTLITLDHHTDTVHAFRRYLSTSTDGEWDEALKKLPALVADIDWNDDASLLRAVSLLRHDEHIHTAILADIIGQAFAINLSDQTPSIEEQKFYEAVSNRFQLVLEGADIGPEPELGSPPYSYEPREDRIYAVRAECAIGCKKVPHDDACDVERAGQVLESFYLDHELSTANEMAKAIGLESVEVGPYILDIDLDYFHSKKGIAPDDAETFHRLIRNSVAVTVALEDECVRELRCDGEEITSKSLLPALMAHIERALA